MLSVQWRGSNPCLQRGTVHVSGTNKRAFFFFFLLQRARSERCRGFQLHTMGMSGSALQGCHREGILLPVTMNRKPSPPPEPTQTFDVKGGSRSRCGSTAHSCLGCLATSPHHARAAVSSAQTEQGRMTSDGKGNKLKPLRLLLSWFGVFAEDKF